jgi:hypothetical protein
MRKPLLIAFLVLVFSGCTSTPPSTSSTPDTDPPTAGPALPQPYTYEAAKQLLETEIMTNGLASARGLLTEWMGSSQQVVAECHLLERHMGFVASTTQATLDDFGSDCEYGLLHGFIFGLAEKAHTPAEFFAAASPLCLNSAVDSSDAGFCVHGLGHGFAVASSNSIHSALDACNLVPDEYAFPCSGAVLMEFGEDRMSSRGWSYGHSAENSPQVLTVQDSDIPGLCVGRPESCQQWLWMFHVPPRESLDADSGSLDTLDARLAGEVCMTASLPTAPRDACLMGFGMFAAMLVPLVDLPGAWPPTSSLDADRAARAAVARCSRHPEAGRCLYGLVPPMSSYLYAAAWENIPDFCAFVDQATKPDCLLAVETARNP